MRSKLIESMRGYAPSGNLQFPWFHRIMVSTQDSESCNGSSILPGTMWALGARSPITQLVECVAVSGVNKVHIARDHNVAGSIPAGGVLEMYPISKIPCVKE